jgi:arylsulfatase A-like enzyme
VGATDPFGFHAVENPVHIHDLHATMLHLMGFDHEKLTFHHAGRDFRLTDIAGKVVKEMMAGSLAG